MRETDAAVLDRVYPDRSDLLGISMSGRPDVDSERVEQIRADIQRHRSACGCELGSVFAAIAIVGLVAFHASGKADWTGWSALGRGAVWVVVVSVVGKLLGLAYARLRVIQLRSELAQHLGARIQSPRVPVPHQDVRLDRSFGIPVNPAVNPAVNPVEE
jgi:hypothetical protein